MRVMTSQYEISGKNQAPSNWSKHFPPEHSLPVREKINSLEQAAFWHEVF